MFSFENIYHYDNTNKVDTTICLPVETGISSCWRPCPWTDWPVRKNCGAATWGWPNKCEGLDIDVIAPTIKNILIHYTCSNKVNRLNKQKKYSQNTLYWCSFKSGKVCICYWVLSKCTVTPLVRGRIEHLQTCLNRQILYVPMVFS